MTTSIAIAEKITTLRQVEEKLGLTLSSDSQFFTEWMADLPGTSTFGRNTRRLEIAAIQTKPLQVRQFPTEGNPPTGMVSPPARAKMSAKADFGCVAPDFSLWGYLPKVDAPG